MAEAAPGARPHTAVVPGKTWRRIRNQPSPALAAMIDTVAPRKRGQSAATLASVAGCRLWAIRQPSTPCASANRGLGTPSRISRDDSRMPASMQPSSTPAGKWSAVSAQARTALSQRRTLHHKADFARNGLENMGVEGVISYQADSCIRLFYEDQVKS